MGVRPSFPAGFYVPSPLMGSWDSPPSIPSSAQVVARSAAGKPLMRGRQKCLEERDRLRPCFLPATGKLPKTATWESYLCDWCSGTLLPPVKGITNTLACSPGQSV